MALSIWYKPIFPSAKIIIEHKNVVHKIWRDNMWDIFPSGENECRDSDY